MPSDKTIGGGDDAFNTFLGFAPRKLPPAHPPVLWEKDSADSLLLFANLQPPKLLGL